MELEEVAKLYGDVPLKFSSYYKYSFTYSGIAGDGAMISATYGGSADHIYRYDVTPQTVKTITNEPKTWWHAISIQKDGNEIFDWSDY